MKSYTPQGTGNTEQVQHITGRLCQHYCAVFNQSSNLTTTEIKFTILLTNKLICICLYQSLKAGIRHEELQVAQDLSVSIKINQFTHFRKIETAAV